MGIVCADLQCTALGIVCADLQCTVMGDLVLRVAKFFCTSLRKSRRTRDEAGTPTSGQDR